MIRESKLHPARWTRRTWCVVLIAYALTLTACTPTPTYTTALATCMDTAARAYPTLPDFELKRACNDLARDMGRDDFIQAWHDPQFVKLADRIFR